MTLSEMKYQILHMGQHNPRRCYRLVEDRLESCSAEKDVGVLLNK